MYPVLNASLLSPLPFLSVSFLGPFSRAPPNSLEWPMLFLPGNLSSLSPMFLCLSKYGGRSRARVCVCARYASAAPSVHVRTGAALVCRSEVAARRKGFHRDSFSRRITAIRCNWRASHKDLMHRSVSRFNVAVRRSATAPLHLRAEKPAIGLIEIRDRDRTFSFLFFLFPLPSLIFETKFPIDGNTRMEGGRRGRQTSNLYIFLRPIFVIKEWAISRSAERKKDLSGGTQREALDHGSH